MTITILQNANFYHEFERSNIISICPVDIMVCNCVVLINSSLVYVLITLNSLSIYLVRKGYMPFGAERVYVIWWGKRICHLVRKGYMSFCGERVYVIW